MAHCPTCTYTGEYDDDKECHILTTVKVYNEHTGLLQSKCPNRNKVDKYLRKHKKISLKLIKPICYKRQLNNDGNCPFYEKRVEVVKKKKFPIASIIVVTLVVGLIVYFILR